jgi:prolyl-tRNA synthetase
MPIVADLALEGRRNMIAGANKNDQHLRHVTPGRDFQARFADVREAEDGEACVKCSQPLSRQKCIEVGHIFKLGYKYSESMGLSVLDADGKEVTPIMGSYGIGLERILTAAIEQAHDEAGMILPAAIAPFEVVVTPVNMKDDAQREAAEALYQQCLDAGIDTLLDDRAERAGVKFKDAELIGVPYRLTLGKKLSEGLVELSERSTRQSTDVRLEEASTAVRQRLRS